MLPLPLSLSQPNTFSQFRRHCQGRCFRGIVGGVRGVAPHMRYGCRLTSGARCGNGRSVYRLSCGGVGCKCSRSALNHTSFATDPRPQGTERELRSFVMWAGCLKQVECTVSALRRPKHKRLMYCWFGI